MRNSWQSSGQCARGVKAEQREIRLTIRCIHQMLVIKVENPFVALPNEKDGVLQTAKAQNGLHGV